MAPIMVVKVAACLGGCVVGTTFFFADSTPPAEMTDAARAVDSCPNLARRINDRSSDYFRLLLEQPGSTPLEHTGELSPDELALHFETHQRSQAIRHIVFTEDGGAELFDRHGCLLANVEMLPAETPAVVAALIAKRRK